MLEKHVQPLQKTFGPHAWARKPVQYTLRRAESSPVNREKLTPPEKEFINRGAGGRGPGMGSNVRTRSSEVNKVLDALEQMGASLSRSGKSRIKVQVPGRSGSVFVSNTPSDKRAVKNFKSDVRRVLKTEV